MIKCFKKKIYACKKKYRRARIAYFNRKTAYNDAEKYIRRNSIENEYDFRSDIELSSNLLNQGKYDEAEQLLKRIVNIHEVAPKNPNFRWWNGQAKLKLAQLEYKRLRVVKSINYLKSIKFYSGFNDFYIANELLARLNNYREDYEGAFAVYNQIIKANYRNIEKVSEPYFELSKKLFPDLSAEEILKEQHNLEMEHFSSVALAKYYLSVSDYEKARKFAKKISTYEVSHFLIMGDINIQIGDYDKAWLSFFRAWKCQPFRLKTIAKCFWVVAGNNDTAFINILIRILIRMPFVKRRRSAYRRLAMLSGDTGSVLNSYEDTVGTKGLLKSLPEKYVSSVMASELCNKSLLVLPLWGIGDEIIIGSVYHDLHAKAASENIKLTIATEPRLLKLMQNSFPKLDFISVDRKHRGPHLNKVSEQDVLNGEVLPNQDLYYTLDYSTWLKIDDYDFILPAPIAAKDLRQTVEGFRKADGQYLVPDKAIAAQFKERLDKISSKPKIGISWRSGYSSKQRSLYYTKLLQWEEIFKLSKYVDFVSLQYDNCEAELESVKSIFGVEIIVLEGVDLFDDLDSVCSLISVMDMTIAPCTVMAEFSGALGVRTLHLTNSLEGKWRSKKDSGDIWFDSVQFITPNRQGDNASMLLNAASEIRNQFVVSS